MKPLFEYIFNMDFSQAPNYEYIYSLVDKAIEHHVERDQFNRVVPHSFEWCGESDIRIKRVKLIECSQMDHSYEI